MRGIHRFGLAAVLAGLAMADEPKTLGTVVRLDAGLDSLIAKDAKVELLVEKRFHWSEGPVWMKGGKRLVFSDVPKNEAWQWTEAGGLEAFLKPSGFTGPVDRPGESGSNGLTVDAEGRLLLCQHGDRRVARLAADGKSFETVADRFDGRRFNSPNDLVVKSNGDIYFTDPIYGLVKGENDPAREIPWCGVYRVAKDGKVTLLTKELSRPNGIGFSPDEKTLYVANSDPARPIWMSFPVLDDGTLGDGKVFADSADVMKKGRPGLPDGLKVDRKGNVWATGPGGVWVIAPDGKVLGRVDTGVPTANCGFGDDGSTLYITADKNLARIKTLTVGLGF
jgi:gluconolactonase